MKKNKANTNLNQYVVLDVETSDYKNSRICQISILKIKDKKVIERFDSYINPESEFCWNATNVHGITESTVQDAPTLQELWPQIADFIQNEIIVCHNYSFDCNAMAKALKYYDITLPDLKCLCTLQLSRSFIRTINLNLGELCKDLNIPLENHHNASCDTMATFELLEYLKENYSLDSSFIQTFSYRNHSVSRFTSRYAAEKSKSKIPDFIFNYFDAVQISGNNFVLTGLFHKGNENRHHIHAYIEKNGGLVQNAVTKATNYVIVGTYRENSWKNEFGAKVNNALKNIKIGIDIKIISEDHFVQTVGSDISNT